MSAPVSRHLEPASQFTAAAAALDLTPAQLHLSVASIAACCGVSSGRQNFFAQISWPSLCWLLLSRATSARATRCCCCCRRCRGLNSTCCSSVKSAAADPSPYSGLAEGTLRLMLQLAGWMAGIFLLHQAVQLQRLIALQQQHTTETKTKTKTKKMTIVCVVSFLYRIETTQDSHNKL